MLNIFSIMLLSTLYGYSLDTNIGLMIYNKEDIKMYNSKYDKKKKYDCKSGSDDFIELNVRLSSNEYKVGDIVIEKVEILIKNISGDEIYLPGYLGYSDIILELSIKFFLVDEKDNIIETKKEKSYGNWCNIKGAPSFDKLTNLYPFHFLGYTYFNVEFSIDNPGIYKLFVSVDCHNLRDSIRQRYKDKIKTYEEKIERVWSGCVVSKPIEIVVKK